MKGKMEILSDRKGEKKSPVLKAKTAPFWGALLTAPPCKQHFGAKPRVSGLLPLPTSPSEPSNPHFVFKTPQLVSNPPSITSHPPSFAFNPPKPHPEPQPPPLLKARHPPSLTFGSEPDDIFLAPRFSPPPPPYKAGEGERGGGQRTGRG